MNKLPIRDPTCAKHSLYRYHRFNDQIYDIKQNEFLNVQMFSD